MRHPGLDYGGPGAFRITQRITLAFAPPAAAFVLRAIGFTCRLEVRNREFLEDAIAQHGRVLIALWHESLGLAIWFFAGRGYHTITSLSFDGELAARLCEQFGVHALRGSSTRGGLRALVQMQRALEADITAGITLDGPKGPRREAKPGVAALSARTGAPIVPTALVARPCWRMNSWDRFIFPKPFGRIVCAHFPPIAPPENATPQSIEAKRREIEQSLNTLQTQLEEELGECG